MMNILSIGLVLTSLVTAAVWSPSQPPPPHHDDHREVIVKEGPRVVVVEYDKDADGSTKVLISPQEVASGEDKPAEGMFSGPRELVCDAFGKCKHKIANTLGKTREIVTEAAHGVSDKAHDIEQHAKDASSGAVGKAKDAAGKAKDAAGKAKDAASGAVGKAKETVSGYEERAKEAVNEAIGRSPEVPEKATGNLIGEPLGKAKESVAQGIGKAKKMAGDVVSTVKDGASKAKNFDVVDSPKRIAEDIQRNASGKIEEGVEHVKEQAKETVKKAGQKSLSEIISELKEVTYDVIWYVVARDKIDAITGLIHMLGFSTAYGMCVWVTFVSSYIFGRYLPRTQFGMVQSRIYPVYFKAMAYCVSAALLGHLATQKNGILASMMFQGSSLLSALLMVFTNMVFLEPRATKLMYERMKIEKEEGRGEAAVAVGGKDGMADNGGATVTRTRANAAADRQDVLRLSEKLKRLNTYSSALNVSTLVMLTWHMAYMVRQLQAQATR